MPTCRKCQNTFPNRLIVDGKERILHNRKFCLDCSPFGGRNNKADDPSRLVIRNHNPYNTWTDEQKENFQARLWWASFTRKRKLVELSGGKCKVCGYNKTLKALEFHHRDPVKKKFALNGENLRRYSWKTLLEELEKCDLVCSNCHSEIEDQKFQNKYLKYANRFDKDPSKLGR